MNSDLNFSGVLLEVDQLVVEQLQGPALHQAEPVLHEARHHVQEQIGGEEAHQLENTSMNQFMLQFIRGTHTGA